MVILIVGLVLFGIIGGGVAATRKPLSVRWFERGVRQQTWAADQVDATFGYRDAPPVQPPVEIAVPVMTAPNQLPDAIRFAAAGCRISFILGLLSILPTLLGIFVEAISEGPQVACIFGIGGVALSFGHLVARRALLGSPQHAGSVVTTVGAWTLLHNAGVLFAVAYTTLRPQRGSWGMYSLEMLGVPTVAYVGVSIALGVYLLRSARLVRRELELSAA